MFGVPLKMFLLLCSSWNEEAAFARLLVKHSQIFEVEKGGSWWLQTDVLPSFSNWARMGMEEVPHALPETSLLR